MWSRIFIAAVLLSFYAGALVQAQPDDNLLTFKSRPDLNPPQLYVNISEKGVTPGYIFMAPYQSYQNAAAIYDRDGSLIWYGYGITGIGGNAHNLNVCSYGGIDHLCYFQGQQFSGYARGYSVIMDTNLTQVRTVTSQAGLSALDQHEFNIINDSALVTIYQPQRYDLSYYNVTGGEGWIQNGIFQDINLTAGNLTFQWSAVEHVSFSESYVGPNQSEVAGTGFSAQSPWDYFHINSVDKNSEGDYLVSARHTSTLYKISGADGQIIWRCGGMMSDFALLDGLNWSYQHDARWLSQNDGVDIISFFDNASNGFNQSANSSSGYIIMLNHTADPPTASLLQSYPAPVNLTISSSQGNLQVLNSNTSDWANSNVFVGWGSQPYVTEHDPSGNIIYQANVAANGKMNYRAFKANITLTPKDIPALYTYALDTDSDTVYYMSWNGATEVKSWRIYGRNGCDNGWTLLNTTSKTGFETNYTASGFQWYGMIEAVAANGSGIRNSTNSGVQAFVPGPFLNGSCSTDGCSIATEYRSGGGQQAIAVVEGNCLASPLDMPTESETNGTTTTNSTASPTATSSKTPVTNSAILWQPSYWSIVLILVASSVLIGIIL